MREEDDGDDNSVPVVVTAATELYPSYMLPGESDLISAFKAGRSSGVKIIRS